MLTRLIFLALVLLLSSCRPTFLPITHPRALENYLAMLDESSRRITQIRGSLDIRGVGLLGHFFHERADVIVTSPCYLLWSLRSFFQTPAFMVASNGAYITTFDLNNSFSPYDQIPITNESVVTLFEFPFHPQSLINFFLNRIELSSAKNIEIGVHDSLWRIEADQNDDWHIVALFDESKRVFTEITLENRKQAIVYQVKYSDMKLEQGIMVPKLLTIMAKINKKSVKLNVRFDQLEVNGEKILPDSFFLKSH